MLALAMTAGMPYGAAHRTLEIEAKRKPRHGIRLGSYLSSRKTFANYDLRQIPYGEQPRTLARLVHDSRYKTGRYLVITRGHAQSYVDGTLYDAAGWSNRSRIVKMWEFRPR